MTQYHFVAASEAFLTVEEPLDEVLRERVRNYGEQGKAIDFWLVKRPAFLNAPELKAKYKRENEERVIAEGLKNGVSRAALSKLIGRDITVGPAAPPYVQVDPTAAALARPWVAPMALEAAIN